jgi:phage terminase small subunit
MAGVRNEHGLTPGREHFARLVGGGMSARDAYKVAFPKSQRWSAHVLDSRVYNTVTIPAVKARIKQIQDAAATRAGIDAADILRELYRVATSDIGALTHENGKLKTPAEMDAATRAAIAEIQFAKDGTILGYKLWDKNTALVAAARILGLFARDNQQRAAVPPTMIELVPLRSLAAPEIIDAEGGGGDER